MLVDMLSSFSGQEEFDGGPETHSRLAKLPMKELAQPSAAPQAG